MAAIVLHRILTITIVAFGLCSLAFATDSDRVEAGDTVFAACPGAEFHEDETVLQSLDEGVKIQVSEVSEDRIEGVVEIDGDTRTGWILAQKVHKPDDEKSIAALKEIEEIDLCVNRLGAVQRIDAKDTHFGGEALTLLEGLYSLECLDLSGSRVTNDDLRHLEGLSNLRWLYLDRTTVDDEGLLSLRHLTNLEVLVLSGSKVRGSGLRHLRNLRQLRVLNLSDCEIDDDALVNLSGLNQVHTLALENAPFDGSGLVDLKPMEHLTTLNLSGCSLKTGTLMHLKDAKDLRIIRASEASIPEEDRDALLAANPNLAMFD